MKKILFGLILAVAPLTFAQTEPVTESSAPADESAIVEHRFTLTPFIGYVWGGEIEINDTQLTQGFKSVKFTPNDTYGLRFAMRMPRWPGFQLELSAARQKTQLEDKAKLFAEDPAGEFPPGRTDTLDMRVTQMHASGIWNLRTLTEQQRTEGAGQPFLLGGVGITHFSAVAPIPEDTVLSFVGGGGTKIWLSPNTALRFDARAYLIGSDKGTSITVPITNLDCEGECLRTYRYPNGMIQFEVNLGFSWGYDSLPYLDRSKKN
jgi:hypothetical protein